MRSKQQIQPTMGPKPAFISCSCLARVTVPAGALCSTDRPSPIRFARPPCLCLRSCCYLSSNLMSDEALSLHLTIYVRCTRAQSNSGTWQSTCRLCTLCTRSKALLTGCVHLHACSILEGHRIWSANRFLAPNLGKWCTFFRFLRNSMRSQLVRC